MFPHRRAVCQGGLALAATATWLSRAAGAPTIASPPLDRARVLRNAERYLAEKPVTLVAYRAERSPGGPHDYYSEADYWWPDPANSTGPYVQRDGYSNPAKFVAHREAMIRLSVQVPALAA